MDLIYEFVSGVDKVIENTEKKMTSDHIWVLAIVFEALLLVNVILMN
jgi:hypothetical protein